jgi:hypothetical protein
VLAELDAAIEARNQPIGSTLLCVVIDPDARFIRIANAAHPPAVFVDGMTVELFDGVAGPALGASDGVRNEFARELAPDTALFLYTDGLIERPGLSPTEAIDRLLEACRGIDGSSAWASEFARRATDTLGQPVDDATVVSVRMTVQATPTPKIRQTPARGQVLLRAYVEPRDLRTNALLEVLRQLEKVVRDIDLTVEVIDVTSKFALTEEAGVLAAPTILRAAPEPPVRVIGWFESPLALARALQLPVLPVDTERIS